MRKAARAVRARSGNDAHDGEPQKERRRINGRIKGNGYLLISSSSILLGVVIYRDILPSQQRKSFTKSRRVFVTLVG